MNSVADKKMRPAITKKKMTKPTTASAETLNKNSPSGRTESDEPKILITIHNEHKYMGVLMKLLKEQVRNMKQNRDADFSIMFDIMHYMNQFPDRFHHPREDLLLNLMLKKNDELKPVIEQLFEEHRLIAIKGEKILSNLKSVLKKQSDLKKARLQTECEDYIEAILDHIKLEEGHVFNKATDILSKRDWKEISKHSKAIEDPIFGQYVEERYKNIYHHLSRQVNKAADDFTLLEFIGISALFDSLGPLMSGSEEISTILKKRNQQVFTTHISCYKSLLHPSRLEKSDYVSVPFGCMLRSFDCYVEGLQEIGRVLKKTREKIAEPYSAGFKLFEEIEKDI